MKKPVLFAEINESELAVRMCEASYGLRRPSGMNGEQALNAMDGECRGGWLRAARAAMTYWQECIKGGQKPS